MAITGLPSLQGHKAVILIEENNTFWTLSQALTLQRTDYMYTMSCTALPRLPTMPLAMPILDILQAKVCPHILS